MLVRIPKLGSVGVRSTDDYPPSELPPNAFTSSDNVSFSDGCARKMPGWLPAISGFTKDQLWMQPWEDDDTISIAFGAADEISTTINGVNIVAATILDQAGVASTVSASTGWQSDVFGGFCIMNNRVDIPYYSSAFATPTWTFREIPGWGAATSPAGAVQSVRSFQNHLIALGVVDNPYTVFISDQGSPEAFPTSWDYADPTKLARRFPLQSKDGAIVDGGILNDRFMVYQRYACVALEYVGGAFVMAARRVLDVGLINRDAWVQFQNFHFVVSERSISIHDGSQGTRPDDDYVENRFFGELSDPAAVFVTKDEENHEILVYYPTEGSVPNRILTYNWIDRTWSFATIGSDVRRIVQGIGPAQGSTWAQLAFPWESINQTWAQLARTDRSTKLLQLRDRTVDIRGSSFTKTLNEEIVAAVDSLDDLGWDASDDLLWGSGDSAVDYDAWVERLTIDLDELTGNSGQIKYLDAVYFQACGDGSIDIQFGISNSPRDPPRWGKVRTVDLGTELRREKVDVRLTGRYFHWRAGNWRGEPKPGAWKIATIDLSLQQEGLR
jgi:hypothetical protein